MRKGFTLSELLIALIVAGVIIALAIPVMITNVNNKTFATKVKNIVEIIEQVAEDELITHKTQDLTETDFADPDKLLSETHFHIAKKCSASQSLAQCWKTSASGSDKVTYKSLDGKSSNLGSAITVLLKNGIMLNYKNEPNDPEIAGYFTIDVNGNTKPNIINKDLLSFYITKKGNVLPYEQATTSNGYKIGTRSDPSTWDAFIITQGMSYDECNSIKAEFGIQHCRTGGDGWAAAVKECGGVQHMLKDEDLYELAKQIYGAENCDNSNKRCEGTPDFNKVPNLQEAGFGSSWFGIWSSDNEPSHSSYAYYRSFRSNSNRSDVLRNSSGVMAVCVK